MLRAALIYMVLSASKMPINGTNAFAKAFCGMQYERMLATGRSCFLSIGAGLLIPPFWSGVGLLRRRDVYSCEASGLFIQMLFHNCHFL